MSIKKLVCNLDESLLKEVDLYASSLHITRTSAVAVLLSTALDNKRAIDSMSDFTALFKQHMKSGDFDGNS